MATNTLIATFYSFKGGVGRTLSLVNTAVALTNMGKSVIIWDMDVEAPGIQNIPYFEPLSKKITGGFVDIVSDYKKNKYRDLDAERFTRYLATHPENEKLRLLPVGNIKDDASYARKFNAIEWEKLFGRTTGAKDRTVGYRLFELIRRQLEAFHPDFILIDSRTGYTDIGGVCCVQLPDVVFLVFNYGRQNLRGIRSIHNVLTNENRMARLRAGRYYKTFLVASMVPGDMPELREKRRRDWKEYNLDPHFEIPYNTEVAFNETVWTAEYPGEEYSGRFVKICKTLVAERDYLLAQGKDERVRPAAIELERKGFPYAKAREFENKTAELFRLMGYEAEVDKAMGGSQIDIFLTRKDQIESFHYIVECKDWEKNVDKTVVDEVENNLKSVQNSFSSCRAIIVARKGFTKEAKKYAASLSIKVRTYDELLNNIVNFNQYVSGIKTLYAGTKLEKNYVEQDIVVEDSEGAVPALDFFSQWLDRDEGGHFTLLGDYGTGKTSLSKRLVHDMALEYENDKTENRMPVLINLKDAQKALGLENIIYNHFLKAAQLNVSPETILLLLREGKILLIFDGFDEMATQTNAALTMQNFLELNRAFTGSAKIILTCRTHYFRDRAETEETLKQKNTGLSETSTALYRAIKGKAGYSIGYLQEFSGGQIEMYLKKTLPDTWPEAKRTINNIYNLKDLSARPVLLDMIVKSLPEISNRKRGVQAADLYATYVRIWEERDDWRQEITREGRECLVEEIAQRLWTRETESLHYSTLNEVLGNYLKEKKTVVSATDIELASSEVRTASFLTRDDYGNYGFAHRSFMEFFLARRLAGRLRQGKTECLAIRRLSKEVILFLGRLSDKDFLVETSQGILAKKYQKQISENALFILYWAVRFTHSPDGKISSIKKLKQMFSKARPKTIKLMRADLDRAELSCMDLSRADLAHAGCSASILSNACLTSAHLNNADLSMSDLESAELSNASLAGADAHHALFDQSNMEHTDLENANLYAASLVNTRLVGARFSNTNLSRAGLLGATIDSNALADQKTCGAGMPHTKPADLDPVILKGHSLWVASVAISPDGKTVASGSRDRSTKLWDMETGREIRSLIGHSDGVLSVAISPDGKILASGSADRSIKLWDIKTGREIRSLIGHSDGVLSVAISPDGKTVASGSADRSIKLWDIKTGREIRSLIGHSYIVSSVVISPDGKTLASGSWDFSIKLWEMETGRETRSLAGHLGSVSSVAISPDGKTLASGSEDTSIKLWDMKTGREIRSFVGHSSHVSSVAISPDGKTLASGSADESIKLWDIATGKEIRSLIGHSNSVVSVAISPDGKTLAGGTESGSCLLLEIARKGEKITEVRQKATLWHLPDGQWAALDARNHYVCSKQGRAYISFADRLANYPATVVPELERPNGLSII
jgi:uncharacterized protein YjbI with pentapeptide repeats